MSPCLRLVSVYEHMVQGVGVGKRASVSAAAAEVYIMMTGGTARPGWAILLCTICSQQFLNTVTCTTTLTPQRTARYWASVVSTLLTSSDHAFNLSASSLLSSLSPGHRVYFHPPSTYLYRYHWNVRNFRKTFCGDSSRSWDIPDGYITYLESDASQLPVCNVSNTPK